MPMLVQWHGAGEHVIHTAKRREKYGGVLPLGAAFGTP